MALKYFIHVYVYICMYVCMYKPQGVGSSGKNIGLYSSPMRSKVRIPLSANNSLSLAYRQSRSITRSVWRGRFTQVRRLPNMD